VRARLFVIAAICAFAAMVSVSFGAQRMQKSSIIFSATENLGQCQGFSVMTDYVTKFTALDFFDKDGNWLKGKTQYRILGESVYYNSANPTKAVSGGPGEVANQFWDLTAGEIRVSGLIYKVRIPGYGPIYYETGELVWQCDPGTFSNCSVVSNTGHNQSVEGDVAALCEYLK